MSGIRVTDRRMFTPEGDLREEVKRELESGSQSADVQAQAAESDSESQRPAGAGPTPFAAPAASAQQPPVAPPLELPGTPPGLGAPTFYDLISVLGEPAALYLGDVRLPDGSSAENLDLARFHIDLLDLLRQRTQGSLSVQERAVLEDLIYRLRLRYVQKRG